jgi:hypothetical protein
MGIQVVEFVNNHNVLSVYVTHEILNRRTSPLEREIGDGVEWLLCECWLMCLVIGVVNSEEVIRNALAPHQVHQVFTRPSVGLSPLGGWRHSVLLANLSLRAEREWSCT